MGAGKPGPNVGTHGIVYRWMMAGAEQEMGDMEGLDVSEFADCQAEASNSPGRDASEKRWKSLVTPQPAFCIQKQTRQ